MQVLPTVYFTQALPVIFVINMTSEKRVFLFWSQGKRYHIFEALSICVFVYSICLCVGHDSNNNNINNMHVHRKYMVCTTNKGSSASVYMDT